MAFGSVCEKERPSENQKLQKEFPDISQTCILNICKVKLPLCLTKLYAMKVYGGVDA
jgi:hypothetical protein